MSLLSTIVSGEFWQLKDHEAIGLFGREFKAELDHLKKATPTAEATSVYARGNLCGQDLTPSRYLYNENYAEVDRTMVSMLALRWIMNDDYEAFAGHQNDGIRLSQQSWRELKMTFKDLLVHPNDTQALLVATVVSDIGKDAKLVDDPKLIHSPSLDADEKANHDEIAFLASESHLVAPIELLSKMDGEDVKLGLRLATRLNVAQLAQGENVPGSLTPLFALRGYRRAFDLKMAEIILDVAGASGHREARCAQQMTEPTFRTYHATIQALRDLLDGKLSDQQECYDQVLTAKAETLHSLGFRLLSPRIPRERVLLRLLSMGRVATLNVAETFSDAFDNVLNEGHASLVPRLNAAGLSAASVAILPYYAPALCANIISSSKSDTTRLKSALEAFMRFLERACDASHFRVRNNEYIHELDLRFASDTLRSPDFIHNPRVLDDVQIPYSHHSS